ncbi:X-Pro dipeptidyl-peptidase [Allocatelliglobosispora scoriae]|uniref:Xaa-Pro dipeptidyl-peptidase n=1 Tax=Allocatelliglobosispora scoriae TaxID=643052 RepID=A0A841BLH5_9ACTN|nr:Xaa-Pro dipeptidyl-peptidase [Allocatelliglobosispora scoriae]MBB5868106.1 X-Pro dipeptidyl-peptidase [Allocatelliglobosispora scoriae]
MRFTHRVPIALALLATALSASTTGASAATPPQAPLAQIEERVYVESSVDSNGDGRLDRIAIDIARPSTGGPVPVVFEQSPYRNGLANAANHGVNVSALPQESLFPISPGSAATAGPGVSVAKPIPDLPDWYDDYFVPKGYAVVLGHSLGTGDSEGCPTSGDMQETLGTTAVVDWLNGRARGFNASGALVTASWSTGNVGMIGISYNGTLPNMAAATGVAGLKAIVPISAISSWYDYYRANGLVVAPGGYQGEDADVLARAVVDRTDCTSRINQIETDQDRVTGDYRQFWADRDYVGKANRVTAGVFVIHGQADWNVKGQHYAQWWDALRANNVPRKIWLHNGGHGTTSRSDYKATVERWFEYFLKGVNNGILTEPKAEVQFKDGTWRQYADWPNPGATDAVFKLDATSSTAPGGLTLGTPTGTSAQSFTDNGRTSTATTLVASPDSANGSRLVYRTGNLAAAVTLTGSPRVSLRLAVTNRNDANVTALLVDYGGTGTSTTPVIVTRGWIDPQNRNSRATGERVVPGTDYTLAFAMQPKDYVFAAGHRIGLVVISTDYDYTLRPPAGAVLRLNPVASTLTIAQTGLATGNDYAISVSPAAGATNPGGSLSATVATAVTSGSGQSVALSASGLPSGVTASFTPSTVTAGGSSALTLSTTASVAPGTYQITIIGTGTSATRTAAYSLTVNGPGGCTATNPTDVAIPDAGAAVESTITISGCPGTASASSTAEVHIIHPYRGDLVVSLVAPDGTSYSLSNRSGGSADDIHQTYPVNLSSETANGTWRLRVQDAASADVGRIDTWTLTLSP